MGRKGDYDLSLYLVAKKDAQIRDNALEAARVVAHKFLSSKLGENYFFKILVFPHHVLREKPIATGAGADRYSQGMRLAFGKPAGHAVQAKKGKKLMLLQINENYLEIGKRALKRASSKLSTPTQVQVVKNK
jgi:large subunit ribosomal protein L10e